MSKKISRKEMLKKPDEFMSLTSKAIQFVKGHKRQFDYLGTAVLALVAIYLGLYAYMKYINNKGQEAYNAVYYSILNNTGSDDSQADPEKIEEAFREVIEKYGMSKAAKLSLLEIAYYKFQQKQYDEAIDMYEEYLNKISETDPNISLTRLSISTCYEQKGDYEKAMEPLQKIMEGPDDFIKEQAMLSLARIYRLAGKQDDSNEILKQFKEKFPKSDFLDLADSLQSS